MAACPSVYILVSLISITLVSAGHRDAKTGRSGTNGGIPILNEPDSENNKPWQLIYKSKSTNEKKEDIQPKPKSVSIPGLSKLTPSILSDNINQEKHIDADGKPWQLIYHSSEKMTKKEDFPGEQVTTNVDSVVLNERRNSASRIAAARDSAGQDVPAFLNSALYDTLLSSIADNLKTFINSNQEDVDYRRPQRMGRYRYVENGRYGVPIERELRRLREYFPPEDLPPRQISDRFAGQSRYRNRPTDVFSSSELMRVDASPTRRDIPSSQNFNEPPTFSRNNERFPFRQDPMTWPGYQKRTSEIPSLPVRQTVGREPPIMDIPARTSFEPPRYNSPSIDAYSNAAPRTSSLNNMNDPLLPSPNEIVGMAIGNMDSKLLRSEYTVTGQNQQSSYSTYGNQHQPTQVLSPLQQGILSPITIQPSLQNQPYQQQPPAYANVIMSNNQPIYRNSIQKPSIQSNTIQTSTSTQNGQTVQGQYIQRQSTQTVQSAQVPYITIPSKQNVQTVIPGQQTQTIQLPQPYNPTQQTIQSPQPYIQAQQNNQPAYNQYIQDVQSSPLNTVQQAYNVQSPSGQYISSTHMRNVRTINIGNPTTRTAQSVINPGSSTQIVRSGQVQHISSQHTPTVPVEVQQGQNAQTTNGQYKATQYISGTPKSNVQTSSQTYTSGTQAQNVQPVQNSQVPTIQNLHAIPQSQTQIQNTQAVHNRQGPTVQSVQAIPQPHTQIQTVQAIHNNQGPTVQSVQAIPQPHTQIQNVQAVQNSQGPTVQSVQAIPQSHRQIQDTHPVQNSQGLAVQNVQAIPQPHIKIQNTQPVQNSQGPTVQNVQAIPQTHTQIQNEQPVPNSQGPTVQNVQAIPRTHTQIQNTQAVQNSQGPTVQNVQAIPQPHNQIHNTQPVPNSQGPTVQNVQAIPQPHTQLQNVQTVHLQGIQGQRNQNSQPVQTIQRQILAVTNMQHPPNRNVQLIQTTQGHSNQHVQSGPMQTNQNVQSVQTVQSSQNQNMELVPIQSMQTPPIQNMQPVQISQGQSNQKMQSVLGQNIHGSPLQNMQTEQRHSIQGPPRNVRPSRMQYIPNPPTTQTVQNIPHRAEASTSIQSNSAPTLEIHPGTRVSIGLDPANNLKFKVTAETNAGKVGNMHLAQNMISSQNNFRHISNSIQMGNPNNIGNTVGMPHEIITDSINALGPHDTSSSARAIAEEIIKSSTNQMYEPEYYTPSPNINWVDPDPLPYEMKKGKKTPSNLSNSNSTQNGLHKSWFNHPATTSTTYIVGTSPKDALHIKTLDNHLTEESTVSNLLKTSDAIKQLLQRYKTMHSAFLGNIIKELQDEKKKTKEFQTPKTIPHYKTPNVKSKISKEIQTPTTMPHSKTAIIKSKNQRKSNIPNKNSSMKNSTSRQTAIVSKLEKHVNPFTNSSESVVNLGSTPAREKNISSSVISKSQKKAQLLKKLLKYIRSKSAISSGSKKSLSPSKSEVKRTKEHQKSEKKTKANNKKATANSKQGNVKSVNIANSGKQTKKSAASKGGKGMAMSLKVRQVSLDPTWKSDYIVTPLESPTETLADPVSPSKGIESGRHSI